jgi:hypothetical protein
MITIVETARPEDESKHSYIRDRFIECPTCRAKPGGPALCAECLERRELWYLAQKHKLLPRR